MLKIHHINAGILCPWGGRLVDGFSHGVRGRLVCHCWLIETPQGLVLVDTGLGSEDIRRSDERLTPFFRHWANPRLNMQDTALAQVERLGYRAQDVKHILLTHLDLDHAGGIQDFPQAQVHVLESEWAAARSPRGWLERRRYSPQQLHNSETWITYQDFEESWFEFSATRVRGLSAEILFVPLAGHSQGHAGVAVNTDQGWMLHAGDAYAYRREMEVDGYHCTLGLRAYQRLMDVDRNARLTTLMRLRRLVREHSERVRICSSHDAIELAAYQAAAEPLRRLQDQIRNLTISAEPSVT